MIKLTIENNYFLKVNLLIIIKIIKYGTKAFSK